MFESGCAGRACVRNATRTICRGVQVLPVQCMRSIERGFLVQTSCACTTLYTTAFVNSVASRAVFSSCQPQGHPPTSASSANTTSPGASKQRSSSFGSAERSWLAGSQPDEAGTTSIKLLEFDLALRAYEQADRSSRGRRKRPSWDCSACPKRRVHTKRSQSPLDPAELTLSL